MPEPVLALQNLALWSLAYNQTITARPLNQQEYYPIEPFVLPVSFSSSLLLVLAENLNAKEWWYLGCKLEQRISVAVSPGVSTGRFAKSPVNVPKLIRFPLYADEYQLKVFIPGWFDRMKLVIWEYIGLTGDTTEQLIEESTDLIRVQLLRMELVLNEINSGINQP